VREERKERILKKKGGRKKEKKKEKRKTLVGESADVLIHGSFQSQRCQRRRLRNLRRQAQVHRLVAVDDTEVHHVLLDRIEETREVIGLESTILKAGKVVKLNETQL
jgi:hypothetical protein